MNTVNSRIHSLNPELFSFLRLTLATEYHSYHSTSFYDWDKDCTDVDYTIIITINEDELDLIDELLNKFKDNLT